MSPVFGVLRPWGVTGGVPKFSPIFGVSGTWGSLERGRLSLVFRGLRDLGGD